MQYVGRSSLFQPFIYMWIYRHEVVNIDQKNKPDWFLEKNPLGKVPTLEQDQRIVFDSLICCDYLDEVYPENRLTPSDPYRQAQDKMLLMFFSQVNQLVGHQCRTT